MNLQAAQNTASLSGSNKSSSGSVGVSFGTSGIGITASASAARGREAGDDLAHTNTHITAGNAVRIQSGNDTTLQGALVKAETIQANVGGDLKIESLQDTSTYTSKQSSASASVTVGAGAGGSFSASKSNVKSEYASVAEQSGLKAGDGGFQVNVNGNTELIGGAIASNQSAVDEGKNRFSTGGELNTTDIRNEARYSASSTSVGTGSVGQNLAMNGLGAGVGRDSGSASSTTTAGISGMAGDKAIRSTDAETGIQRIFDKETVQKEIAAQTLITETFSREAPKAVASYAGAQERALTQQLRDETDPVKQEALQVEIDKWKEGGVYRVALHTAAGALGGGLGGAAGAAVSGASANLMNAWQDSLQQSLETAGLGGTAAQGVAQGIATITAAGVGAAVGGTYGAASAATVDANNRQLHPSEKERAQELAKKSGGKYTAEQIEEQMRLMGNKAFNEAANTTEVLTTTQEIASNLTQDPNMPKTVDGMVIVEIPGQANVELQQYIIGNSKGADYIPGQSPYVASNAALNATSSAYSPSSTTTTSKCANGDLACISGVGAQQSSIPELTQAAKASIADGAANVSRQAGVIAAGATATAAAGSPQVKPIAGAVTLGATAIAVGADVVEQVMRPNTGQAATNGAALIVQTAVEQTPVGRVAAPITNEVLEMWKSSGSSQSIQEWLNTRLQGTKP